MHLKINKAHNKFAITCPLNVFKGVNPDKKENKFDTLGALAGTIIIIANYLNY